MKKRKTKPVENRMGNLLRAARMNAGLSQAEIAQKLGYGNSQFVSNWERGASRPPLKVLKKVATLLKVSPQDLFQALLESSIEKLTSDLKKEFKGG